jgi:hypothetical protein
LELHKKIIQAWKNEFGDLKKSSSVLSQLLSSKFNGNQPPTDEEIKKALDDLMEVPKIAPLVAIILASPIPGSSLGYLVVMNSLKKITKDKIDLVPKRFGEIFDKEEKKNDNS